MSSKGGLIWFDSTMDKDVHQQQQKRAVRIRIHGTAGFKHINLGKNDSDPGEFEN